MAEPQPNDDRDPEYDGPWTDCWQCGGDGFVADCWEEFACVDPEGGCDECVTACDICHGAGGWSAEDPPFALASPTEKGGSSNA